MLGGKAAAALGLKMTDLKDADNSSASVGDLPDQRFRPARRELSWLWRGGSGFTCTCPVASTQDSSSRKPATIHSYRPPSTPTDPEPLSWLEDDDELDPLPLSEKLPLPKSVCELLPLSPQELLLLPPQSDPEPEEFEEPKKDPNVEDASLVDGPLEKMADGAS